MAALPKEQLDQFLAKVPTLNSDKLVKLFVKTREARAALTRSYDAEKAQLDQIMQMCENFMLKAADAAGVTGFTTEYGTTYAANKMNLSIADDAAFYGFVLAQKDLDFFERRVSSRHVEDYMKTAGGAVPPGLNVFRERVMRVRKAGDK
jgi:hypothetical protein